MEKEKAEQRWSKIESYLLQLVSSPPLFLFPFACQKIIKLRNRERSEEREREKTLWSKRVICIYLENLYVELCKRLVAVYYYFVQFSVRLVTLARGRGYRYEEYVIFRWIFIAVTRDRAFVRYHPFIPAYFVCTLIVMCVYDIRLYIDRSLYSFSRINVKFHLLLIETIWNNAQTHNVKFRLSLVFLHSMRRNRRCRSSLHSRDIITRRHRNILSQFCELIFQKERFVLFFSRRWFALLHTKSR